MQKISNKFTVFFDAPFWVGVYERFGAEKVEVCKIVFGPEPKDYEVYQYLLQNWSNLRFSPPVKAQIRSAANINPKRLQRLINKQLKPEGVGTRSQQALKLQHDENKLVKRSMSRKQREEEQQRKFEIRQQKRKEKHRGR